MLFKHSNLNSNLALTLGYLNPALNNSALNRCKFQDKKCWLGNVRNSKPVKFCFKFLAS